MRIVIPCKPFSHGKSRLAGVMDEPARRDLCMSLLDRTLGLAGGVADSAGILVVTADAGAAAIAKDHGASVLPETSRGLNAALSFARDSLVGDPAAAGGSGLLVLPIDLVCASASDIRAFLESRADVVIAPDRPRQGTNLLLLSAKAAPVFGFAFGKESFARHCRTARELGLALAVHDNPALAFDLDLPVDYAAWMRSGGFDRDARARMASP